MFNQAIDVQGKRSINYNYQETIETLNSLQSNAATIKEMLKSPRISSREDTKKYLLRSGLTCVQLNQLSVIHVSGTKGKGSTCAFVESILRKHGYRTGFFSSPHLVSARERFRINGQPINETIFTNYFWKVYKILHERREHEKDMPQYFKFLTIMMFHLFLESDLDVSIIEVGIGGEDDCTNVLQNPVCTGVTSLGLEHTAILGNTLTEIAYNKAGIFKQNAPAFTVPQPEEAMKVLEDKSREKNCELVIVPRLEDYPWKNGLPTLGIRSSIQFFNASLAIELARHWMTDPGINRKRYQMNKIFDGSQLGNSSGFFENVEAAISECRWPGRSQYYSGKIADFYLDGAHTSESIKGCVTWFRDAIGRCKGEKYLVFNVTGDRDSNEFLSILREIEFDSAYFIPNIAGVSSTVDQKSAVYSLREQKLKCQRHGNFWGEGAVTADSFYEFLKLLEERSRISTKKPKVLVTGSLHLVGAALAVLDPNLTMKTQL